MCLAYEAVVNFSFSFKDHEDCKNEVDLSFWTAFNDDESIDFALEVEVGGYLIAMWENILAFNN